jgi:hypothetical protein
MAWVESVVVGTGGTAVESAEADWAESGGAPVESIEATQLGPGQTGGPDARSESAARRIATIGTP